MSEVNQTEQQLVEAEGDAAVHSGAGLATSTDAPAKAQSEAETEERVAPRVMLYIRSAKLISGEGEFVCVIRDVSTTGVSVRSFHPIPDRKDMILQMQSGDTYPVEMVWSRENQAGFRFASEVDLTRFIAEDGPLPKRPLRFDLDLPVKICVLGQELDAKLRNLSQQGAALECDTRLAISQPMRIKSHLLPDVAAKVRWRRDEIYGIVLENTFRLEDFARLIESLRVKITTQGEGNNRYDRQIQTRN